MSDEELSISDATLIARLRGDHPDYLTSAAADRIEQLVATNEALVRENADLTEVFDMQAKTATRAIKMWQEAHPDNEMVWPDGAKLTVWLMEVADKQAALLADAYGADLDWDDVLKQRADHEAVKKIEALEGERDKYRDAFNTNCLVLRGTEDRAERLEAALRWYEARVADCRKITRDGDTARHELDRDGGEIARAALKGADHE